MFAQIHSENGQTVVKLTALEPNQVKDELNSFKINTIIHNFSKTSEVDSISNERGRILRLPTGIPSIYKWEISKK